MIVVTGGTGLVGGHVLWHLLQKEEQVYAIRRQSGNPEVLRTIFRFYTENPDVFLSRISWIEADVLDALQISEALRKARYVYHCAAVVSLGSDASEIQEVNVTGTRNVVDACLKNSVEKLCFVSSIAACGGYENGAFVDENSTWHDSASQSAYARSKYFSEQEIWKGMKQGLAAVIVNPGVILGVSGTENGSAELFSRVKKGLPFYTEGGSGYVDVQDVAKIMILLTESEITGERFVLVAENLSNLQILTAIAAGFGKKVPRIAVGKNALLLIGFLAEITGKLVGFRPFIDRGTARSTTNTACYSSAKLLKTINYEFSPIDRCIAEVCRFKNENQI